MTVREFNFPEVIYKEHLKEIQGIKFTTREIEIIAFILSGRSGKKTASFFSISPKTVENYTHNIKEKLRCNSREGIIDFIEKSGRFLIIKRYYLSLLIHADFEAALKKIAISNEKTSCSIVRWQFQEDGYGLLPYLKTHLKLAGFKVFYDNRRQHKSFHHLLDEPSQGTYRVYLLPALIRKEFQNPGSDLSHSNPPKKEFQRKLFIFPAKEEGTLSIEGGGNYLDLAKHKNYYLLVLEILKRLLPNHRIENTMVAFKKRIETLSNFPSDEKLFKLSEQYRSVGKFHLGAITQRMLKKKKCSIFFVCMFLGAVSLWFHYSYNHGRQKLLSYRDRINLPIRSDLVIPVESILLDRPEFRIQIEDKLKERPDGIQTIALVGTGGAGKTTLARQVARMQQKIPVVWEINAETGRTLSSSFESLGYALCQTEEEKKKLRELQGIKNLAEREEKIIHWVKGHLKSAQNWLLIYDNVEELNGLQKYVPSDPSAWGKGKIIITTRNNHIQNNNQINGVLRVGELDALQKLNLFVQIIDQGAVRPMSTSQKEKGGKFLKGIPSFPLDVVVAAYYLKTTDLSYEKYPTYLENYNKGFESIQKNILKEVGDYTKTRYSIIALSINKLINGNKDFSNLLLLISLMDSQHIPADLLRTYKNDIIVDNFIFNLKKYFLITTHSSIGPSPTFSIHRSAQVLILAYLINTLGLEKEKALLKPIAETLIKYITTAIDTHDFQTMNLLVNHCEVFLKHPQLLNDFITGTLQGELGGLYFYLGHYSNSITNLEESLIKLNQSFPKKYEEVARSLRYLGNVHRDLGDYEKARDLFEQSHTLYEKHLLHEYSGIARSFTYLGLVYRNLGKYEKTRDLLNRSLVIYEKHVADSKRQMLGIARALAYLGSVERILGDYGNARKHLEKSLALFKSHFPENHLKVGWILAYFGNFYRDVGNQDQAEAFLKKSYTIYIKHFSINHLKVAWVSLLLGNLYHEKGNSAESIKCLKECLAVYEKEYGKNHIETAKVYRNLGQAYVLKGDREEGRKLMDAALAIFERAKHPESSMTLEALGDFYVNGSGQAIIKGEKTQSEALRKQAADCFSQALNLIRIHFPKSSPHAARIQNKLKKTRDQSGQ